MTNQTIENRLQQLEDHIAIKAVVDRFSNLADQKDIATQMQLFTEDAVVETWFGDVLFARLTGPEEIGRTFSNFIASFETMYHLNGQAVITLDGDRATSHHYCHVTLISSNAGKRSRNTNGVIYDDAYVRRADGWKIASRIARFTWRDTAAMAEV